MKSKIFKSLVAGVLLATSTLPVAADVTVNLQTTGKASVINVSGAGVSQIKANRMRSEQLVGGNMQSTIIDIDGRRFVSLDAKKKTALITPRDSIADELAKVGVGTIQATLTKTSQVRKVAGYSCTVYDINISLPFSMTGQPGAGLDLNMVLAGTVCLSTDAPGLADYQKFYRAAADSGFIFGDPRTLKSPLGAAQAKAYAELTRKMAAAGMALESHVTSPPTATTPWPE